MSVVIQAERLTLTTAVDGIAEEQFQEHLDAIQKVIADAECDPRRFEARKGALAFKVTIELTFEHDLEAALTALTARTQLRMPKSRAVKRGARLRGDQWLVDPPAGVQERLPLHPRAVAPNDQE